MSVITTLESATSARRQIRGLRPCRPLNLVCCFVVRYGRCVAFVFVLGVLLCDVAIGGIPLWVALCRSAPELCGVARALLLSSAQGTSTLGRSIMIRSAFIYGIYDAGRMLSTRRDGGGVGVTTRRILMFPSGKLRAAFALRRRSCPSSLAWCVLGAVRVCRGNEVLSVFKRPVSLVWRRVKRAARDAGNDGMLVSASDGARSVGGTQGEKHSREASTATSVPRRSPALPGPGGHVPRKPCVVIWFLSILLSI